MQLPSNVTSSSSLTTRASVWLRSIPLITRAILILCTVIYLFELLFGDAHGSVCESPYRVVFQMQVYRFFTSPWFHSGILHLALNMMAFIPMGATLERTQGSLNFLYIILLFCLLTGLAHNFIAYAAYQTGTYPSLIKECAIGFSGIIFALMVVQIGTDWGSQRSVFGFASVPAKFYPWVLLIVLQLVMPGVSFLGHLSGVLVGYLYSFGVLKRITPSASRLNALETSSALGWLIQRDGYISNPNLGSDVSSGGSSFFGNILPVFRPPTQSFSGSGQTVGSPTLSRNMTYAQPFPPPPAYTPTAAPIPSESGRPPVMFPGTGNMLGR
eukprot:TRINITY_DN4548_c0_g1_i1.p1 TRINITY_DN4548_c0_g1~~TRINITY_DN4548_c0_g1_i1.p1  ORF type:complete len:327 (-),score=22.24 TRINITY_DN4548_c0_g1_i1:26-1006(-)